MGEIKISSVKKNSDKSLLITFTSESTLKKGDFEKATVNSKDFDIVAADVDEGKKTLIVKDLSEELVDINTSLIIDLAKADGTKLVSYAEEKKVIIAYGEFGFLGGTLKGYYNSEEKIIAGTTTEPIKLGSVKNETFKSAVDFLGMKDSEVRLTCEVNGKQKYQKFLFELDNDKGDNLIGGDTFLKDFELSVKKLSIGYFGGQDIPEKDKKEFSAWVTKKYTELNEG